MRFPKSNSHRELEAFVDICLILVFAYGAINDPCVFAIFADWRQVALEIDACRTDVTSLGWGGVGMLTFMLTCVTCTTDVTSLGWGGVGMLTFMWKELGKLAKKSRR